MTNDKETLKEGKACNVKAASKLKAILLTLVIRKWPWKERRVSKQDERLQDHEASGGEVI